jgi:hypothetical protein
LRTTILASVIAIALYAPPKHSYVGKAYSRGTGEVCFEVPEGAVDWAATALDSLGAETVENPSVELLRRNYFEPGGASVLRFEAPVPLQISEKHWVVLHETGLVALHPTRLRGKLFYSVDRSFKVLGQPKAFGEACGPVADLSLRAAFVLEDVSVDGWSQEAASATTEGRRRFAIDWAGQRYVLENPDFAVPRIKKVLVLRCAGETTMALFVWEPDPHCEALCCEFAYSLYELGAQGVIRLLGENGYGCDV